MRRALCDVAASADTVLEGVPGDLADAVAATLRLCTGAGRLLDTPSTPSTPSTSGTAWRPALAVGAVLRDATTLGLSPDGAAAHGTLALAHAGAGAGGLELPAGVAALAVQHTHAGGQVCVLLLQHRPFEMAATHAVGRGGSLAAPPALLPRDPQLPRALAHKFKRTLQKAQHTALVRSVVPVHAPLDAVLTCSPFGVVWSTQMHEVDFYSVFA